MGRFSQVAKLGLRGLILASPVVAGLLTYVACDPFRVLRAHEFGNYYDEAAPVELNRDYVSLNLLERNYPEQHYDAFIFGSSRTFPFHVDAWTPYLSDAHPFHYPAASETIYGMEKKLAYLEAKGIRVRYAILEMSAALGQAAPQYDAMHRLHYRITGESWLDYQAGVLKSYFTDFYFLRYMDYRLTGQLRESSRKVLGIRPGMVVIDPKTNEYFFAEQDRELAADEAGYFEHHPAYFPPGDGRPPGSYAEPVIHEAHRAILHRIREHLDRLGTDYRILLAPDYPRVFMSRSDVSELEEIFGAARVFDFTGQNEFSAEKKYFYDAGHVRPEVATRILERVYRGPAPQIQSSTVTAP
jgi:hypothetical protein